MAKQVHQMELLAQTFRVLGNATRLQILMTLRDGERNVTALCKKLKSPQPTVSRHLGILRGVGMVNARRSGKEVYYSIGDLQLGRNARGLKALLGTGTSLRLGPMVLGLSRR